MSQSLHIIRVFFLRMALHLDVSVMNEHWARVKEEGISSPRHNRCNNLPNVKRDSRGVCLVIPATSGLVPDVFDYVELLERNIHLYEEAQKSTYRD